jgi:hypothetical protein
MEEEVVDRQSTVIYGEDGTQDFGFAEWDISTTTSRVRLEIDHEAAVEYICRLNKELGHLMWLKERYEREGDYASATNVEQEAQALVRVLKELEG